MRRLLRRRPPRAPCAALAAAVHNLLPSARVGALRTVVYSDRYFLYGLPLRARAASARRLVYDELGAPLAFEQRPRLAAALPSPAHFVPLRAAGVRLAARAGPLLDAAPRRRDPPPRYAPMRRARRDLPHVFTFTPDARFEEVDAPSEYPPRMRALDYRQSAAGAQPVAPRALLDHRVSLLERRSPSPSTLRPQFALPDDEAVTYERVYEEAYDALLKRSARISAANLARDESGKTADKSPVERKVLNTERYNNGAARVRLGGGAQAVRGAAQAMLAYSAAGYALALLAFYFLSLP